MRDLDRIVADAASKADREGRTIDFRTRRIDQDTSRRAKDIEDKSDAQVATELCERAKGLYGIVAGLPEKYRGFVTEHADGLADLASGLVARTDEDEDLPPLERPSGPRPGEPGWAPSGIGSPGGTAAGEGGPGMGGTGGGTGGEGGA